MDTPSDTEHAGEKFFDSDFSRKNFAGHTFEDCSFEKCDFKASSFARARFIDCMFALCDVSNVVLANARLRDVSFTECKLLGLQWIQCDDLIAPRFKECNLSYGNFVGLKLKKSAFSSCKLHDVDFSQTDLAEADFRGADLLNARFNATSLLKADFRGAVNYLIDPVVNKIRGARFSLPEAQGLLAGLGVILE